MLLSEGHATVRTLLPGDDVAQEELKERREGERRAQEEADRMERTRGDRHAMMLRDLAPIRRAIAAEVEKLAPPEPLVSHGAVDACLKTSTRSLRRMHPGMADSRGRPLGSGILIFDGDCGFCTWAAEWSERRLPTDARISPWQFLESELPSYGLSVESASSAVYWVDANGRPHR